MTARHSYLLIGALFMFTNAIMADTSSRLQVLEQPRSGSFFGGMEVASLQTSLQSLTGLGVQFGYRKIFTHRWAGDLSLAQIYGTGSGAGASVLYTAVNASIRYAPLREFAQDNLTVLFDGKKFFEEAMATNSTLAVGLQMTQLILNGSNSIYNATGVGLCLSYDVKAWGYWLRPEIRYGALSSNNTDMTAIFANLLYSF